MNKKIYFWPFLLFLMIAMVSCEPVEYNKLIRKDVLKGFAQKGPFISGSSVTVSELDSTFNQTGRVYSTTIDGDAGMFELKNFELVSPYVLLKADGYYFNEISGQISQSPLTLYTLADVSDVSTVNINVLTHLERGRVEYLISEQGMTLAQAKKQAQTEVLNIFNLQIENDSVSESIVIHGSSVNDAVLMAVSCILQGTLTTAEMTELMSKIVADIKTDGVLNDLSLGSALLDNARLINKTQIRLNLEQKYAEPDSLDRVIPDFEKYIDDFISKTSFTPVKIITYPAEGDQGLNLLHDTITVIEPNQFYSLKAELPIGTSLRVRIKEGIWSYVALPAPLNWTASLYDNVEKSQWFTVGEAGVSNNLSISFPNSGDVTVEYYENQATTPTKSKVISVKDANVPTNPSGEFAFPYWSEFMSYYNILSDSLSSTYAGKVYSMRAHIPAGKTLRVVLKGDGHYWVPEADGKNQGWTVSSYNAVTKSQEFTGSNQVCDMGIVIFGTTSIEFYENESTTPFKVKQLN